MPMNVPDFLRRKKRALLITGCVAVALLLAVLFIAPPLIASSLHGRITAEFSETLRGGAVAVGVAWTRRHSPRGAAVAAQQAARRRRRRRRRGGGGRGGGGGARRGGGRPGGRGGAATAGLRAAGDDVRA